MQKSEAWHISATGRACRVYASITLQEPVRRLLGDSRNVH
jgi:hypothetical protein